MIIKEFAIDKGYKYMLVNSKIYLTFGAIAISLSFLITTSKAVASFCSAALILLAMFITWHERHLSRALIMYISTVTLYIIVISLYLWLENPESAFIFTSKKVILTFCLALAIGLRSELYRLFSLISFIAGVLVLSVIIIYQSFSMDLSLYRAPNHMNAVHAGYLISYGIIVTLILLISFKKYLIPATMIIVLMLFALILNQTRGAWLATAAAMLPLIWRSKNKYILTVITSIFIISLFFIPGVRDRTFNDIKAIQNYTFSSDVETSLGAKIQMWAVSWDMFKEHPLLGIGAGNWQSYTHKMIEEEKAPAILKGFNQPHNTFINALATTGIVGLAATIILVVYPLWLTRNKYSSDSFYALLIKLTSIVFVVQGMTDSVTQMHRPFYSYLLIIGICVSGIIWGNSGIVSNTADSTNKRFE